MSASQAPGCSQPILMPRILAFLPAVRQAAQPTAVGSGWESGPAGSSHWSKVFPA